MAQYFVNSNATGANDGTSWADAWTSLWTSKSTLVDGDIVYVAHNHVEGNVPANQTLTGPGASGSRSVIVSATAGSSPVAYQPGAQIRTLGGTYNLEISGNVSAYGVTWESGSHLYTNMGANVQQFFNCTMKPAGAGVFGNNTSGGGTVELFNCTIDNSNDASNSGNVIIQSRAQGYLCLYDCTYIANATFKRTGSATGTGGSSWAKHRWVGCDFSDLPNIPLADAGQTILEAFNCKLPATFSLQSGVPSNACGRVELVNCSTGNAPHLYAEDSYFGTIGTSTTVYRNASGQIEGTSCSYVMNGLARCQESMPIRSPWIYGVVTSTGTKTFSISIANNSAALENDEIWMELEFPDGASDGMLWHDTTQRTFEATPAAYSSDGGTWTGSPTHKQVMSKTVGCNRTGLVRARVALALSVTDVYIDPKLNVS